MTTARTTSLARGPRDRSLGRFMVAVAGASAIVAVVSAIVGIMLVSSMRRSVDDSLELTGNTLDTVSDSITLSSSIVDTLRISITNVSTALTAVQGSIDTSSTTIGDVGTFLGGPLSATLDTVAATLPTLQSTAGAIDDTLGLLDGIPFGPNYSPAVPLSESIASLSAAVTPLPQQLRALDQDFTNLQTSAADVSRQLTAVIADVDGLTKRLDGINELLDRYQATAAQAEQLTSSSQDEFDRTATLATVLAVLIGILAVASQVVPLWLGRRLQHDERHFDGQLGSEPDAEAGEQGASDPTAGTAAASVGESAYAVEPRSVPARDPDVSGHA